MGALPGAELCVWAGGEGMVEESRYIREKLGCVEELSRMFMVWPAIGVEVAGRALHWLTRRGAAQLRVGTLSVALGRT